MSEVSGVGPPNELRRNVVLRVIGSSVAFAISAIWAGGAMATAVWVAGMTLCVFAAVLMRRGRVGAAARLAVRWLAGLDLQSARRLEQDWREAWAEADARPLTLG